MILYYFYFFIIMTNNLQFAFIYKLYLKDNPNIAYIGQTTNINSRYSQHIKNAKDITSISNKLYFFMNFYGINNFKIDILKTLQDISKYELNKIENDLIKLYGTLNTVNANSNIVLNINQDIILQFTNQLLDKPYTQDYIHTVLTYINKNNTSTNNRINIQYNTELELQTPHKNKQQNKEPIQINELINPPLNIKNKTTQTNTPHDTQETLQKLPNSKAQKMKIYRANLKLNDPEKYKLINDNKALANKTKYHTDPHYKAQQNQKSKDKYITTKFILDNMEQQQKTLLLHKLHTTEDNTQPIKDTSQSTKDNTLPIKDTTQST